MAYGANAPWGLKPIYELISTTGTGQTNTYLIASGYGTSLFEGDRVARLSDGTIGIAPAGVQALGVLAQVSYVDPIGNPIKQPYWPAGATTQAALPAIAYVYDDPFLLFDVQVSTSANVLSPLPSLITANLGLNANLAIGGGSAGFSPPNPTSGNTFTGLSGYYLDLSTVSQDSTLDVKIIRFTPAFSSQFGQNQSGLPFNNVVVQLNNDTYKGTGVGIANDFNKFTPVTTTYTALLSDETIEANPTGGAFTINIPTASLSNRTKKYVIKNVSGSTNTITIEPPAGTIDGASDITISSAYGHVTIVSDGTAWYTV